jgi:hypothetical protein
MSIIELVDRPGAAAVESVDEQTVESQESTEQ